VTGIVKASAVSLSHAVLRIAGGDERIGTRPAIPERDDPGVALQARIEALEEQLRTQHERAKRQERDAFERGYKEGAEQAARELKQQWDNQVDAVARATRTAQDAFEARLATLETLALDLAEAALGRVLGDAARHAELLAQTIAHHLRGMERNVVRLLVSGHDFPSQEALDLLANLPERVRNSIEVRTDLPAGTCQVDLALGHVDLGLPSQRGRLSRTLGALRTHE
jgi:flagellar biosynthesis/type III secretory pathway protein FliH